MTCARSPVSADLLTRENLLRALAGRGGRHERSL